MRGPPESPQQAAAESQAQAGGGTAAGSCQAPGSMSDGGLSDKKLIIYVSSSRGPGAEGRLGHSLLLPEQPRSFLAQIINDQRMNESVIRSVLPALFISFICINSEVRV